MGNFKRGTDEAEREKLWEKGQELEMGGKSRFVQNIIHTQKILKQLRTAKDADPVAGLLTVNQ